MRTSESALSAMIGDDGLVGSLMVADRGRFVGFERSSWALEYGQSLVTISYKQIAV